MQSKSASANQQLVIMSRRMTDLPALTALQLTLLDCMVDDYEDIEQLYLCANRDSKVEGENGIRFPLIVMQVRFALRDIVDEIANMVREAYVEAKYSNLEDFVPDHPLDFTALHHYWFGPTPKGKAAWKAHAERDSAQQ
jgi:hypothetical protein